MMSFSIICLILSMVMMAFSSYQVGKFRERRRIVTGLESYLKKMPAVTEGYATVIYSSKIRTLSDVFDIIFP